MKMKPLFLLLVAVVVVIVSGCISTDSTVEEVKEGDYVLVDYTGKLEDGTVFDTSIKDDAIEAGIYNQKRDYQPLGFTVGAGEMIKGFDKGVVMCVRLRNPPLHQPFSFDVGIASLTKIDVV